MFSPDTSKASSPDSHTGSGTTGNAPEVRSRKTEVGDAPAPVVQKSKSRRKREAKQKRRQRAQGDATSSDVTSASAKQASPEATKPRPAAIAAAAENASTPEVERNNKKPEEDGGLDGIVRLSHYCEAPRGRSALCFNFIVCSSLIG